MITINDISQSKAHNQMMFMHSQLLSEQVCAFKHRVEQSVVLRKVPSSADTGSVSNDNEEMKSALGSTFLMETNLLQLKH